MDLESTTPSPARRGSLRVRWRRALSTLVVVFLLGALASFAGTRSAVGAFRDAALRMDEEAAALERLRNDIVSAALLRSAAVQGLADPGANTELKAATAAEAASFENAIRTLRPGGGREVVQRHYAQHADLWPDDVTVLTPAQFIARAAQGRANFDLLDEAAAASRAQARKDLDRASSLERLVTVATAAVIAILVSLVVVLGRRLSREVLRPVARLRDSAGRIALGDLDHRVEVERQDEIGDLAETFNTMADVVASSHRALTRQANHDALTGLVNRSAFFSRLEATLAEPDRRDGTQAVLFVDLDDFKQVNDALGHAAGDEVLNAVAARLTDSVRPGDVVARVGGDEFAVLLAGVPDDAIRIGERALAALRPPIDVAGTHVRVGASAGLAVRHEGSDAAGLLREADVAMYSAKGHGKDRVEAFDPTVHGSAGATMAGATTAAGQPAPPPD